MADILPRDLQPVPGGTVLPGTVVIIDDGAGVWKASVEQVAATGTPLATSAEVFAGSSVQKYLNPERTVEAINTHSPVRSVNGQAGVVILTKGDIGLGNVENIALSASSGASNIGTTNGQTVQQVINSAIAVPFTIPCFVNPPLDNDEMLFTYVFAQDISFPPDFDGSSGVAIALPAAATTLTILKLPVGEDIADAVPAGEVVYNTDGSFVFTTVGNAPLSFATGEAIITQGQATADASAAYSLTLIGAR